MPRKWDHQTIDRSNEAVDHLIAERLRRDPDLLRAARSNLRRWMEADGLTPRPVFLEWVGILDRLTRDEIASFLASDTPMARRLRQSSPFRGFLTSEEIRHIREVYEEG